MLRQPFQVGNEQAGSGVAQQVEIIAGHDDRIAFGIPLAAIDGERTATSAAPKREGGYSPGGGAGRSWYKKQVELALGAIITPLVERIKDHRGEGNVPLAGL